MRHKMYQYNSYHEFTKTISSYDEFTNMIHHHAHRLHAHRLHVHGRRKQNRDDKSEHANINLIGVHIPYSHRFRPRFGDNRRSEEIEVR